MLNADAQLLIFILIAHIHIHINCSYSFCSIAHIHFLADFQHSCTLLISISNMIQKMVVYADADSHVWACVTELQKLMPCDYTGNVLLGVV